MQCMLTILFKKWKNVACFIGQILNTCVENFLYFAFIFLHFNDNF